jgi:phage terminase small subunit
VPKRRNPHPSGLTPLQAACVDRFMVLRDQTKAYVEARGGKEPRQARTTASRIFRLPQVKAEIAKREEALRRVSDMEAAELIRLWSIEARGDIANYFNGDWTIKQLDEIPKDLTYAIESVRHTTRTTGSGKDRVTTHAVDFKLSDRGRAKESLAKYLGLFKADNEQKANNILAMIQANLNLKALSVEDVRLLREIVRKMQPLPEGEGG